MTELTLHERVTLQAIWDGRTRKEMAHGFGITLSAVDRRSARLMQKLQVSSVVQLVRKGLRDGLLTL